MVAGENNHQHFGVGVVFQLVVFVVDTWQIKTRNGIANIQFRKALGVRRLLSDAGITRQQGGKYDQE